jgi:glutathione synthase/RimK-type ligase-like ATP-grasp enzyme
VSCPEWTTDYFTALSWLEEGSTVFCRTRVQAHSGNGIVIASNPDELVSAPLYTKYIKKKKEFRVHVFNNEVIDIQEKRRAMGSDAGFLIRNHANGFVFCRDDIIEPSDLRDVAIQAVTSLGLDFGAVDVIYNQHYDKCYALEVNTAPGLEGSTLTSYSTKIKELAYGR